MKKLGIVLGAVFVIVVSPFVVQYGWDVLKFNDEWAEYCHEGYVDGSVEGINFVEVVRGEACFEFGKTRYPESSLFIRMEDERLTFAELIKSRDFEFEIIGNVYENPGLLEVE